MRLKSALPSSPQATATGGKRPTDGVYFYRIEPKNGIPDPAKVVRSALQNAASIAALFLTTEAVIAEKPEKEKAPAALGGGDMDF